MLRWWGSLSEATQTNGQNGMVMVVVLKKIASVFSDLDSQPISGTDSQPNLDLSWRISSFHRQQRPNYGLRGAEEGGKRSFTDN